MGPEATVRWISNPLRSPLTLERLFLQAVGPEADLRVERSASELASMLEQSVGAAPRCLLVVQQPETLDAETRDMLARMAGHLAEGPAVVQFLFCCSSAFRPIVPLPAGRNLPMLSLDANALAEAGSPWRPLLPVLLLVVACLGGMQFLMRRTPPGAPAAKPIETSSVHTADVPAVRPVLSEPAAPSLAPAAAAATEGVATPAAAAPALGTSAPGTPALDTPASGTPAVGTPALGVPALGAPNPDSSTVPDSAEPGPRIDVATVRREFDAFLAQQPPRIANLSQQQRDALFEEFLHHYRHEDAQAP
jgi:hypothetical protein